MAAPKRVAVDDTSYEADLSAWALEQAGHLRAGRWSHLDATHIADEIEALSRSERHALTSALQVILLHLLKWDHQPARRTRSWATSIRTQRLAVTDRLEDNPSLVPQAGDLIARAYRRARIEAASETMLPEAAFPLACPYDFDELMTRTIPWPPEGGEA